MTIQAFGPEWVECVDDPDVWMFSEVFARRAAECYEVLEGGYASPGSEWKVVATPSTYADLMLFVYRTLASKVRALEARSRELHDAARHAWGVWDTLAPRTCPLQPGPRLWPDMEVRTLNGQAKKGGGE